MENSIQLTATRRQGSGKGPARRLRAAGKLPAILYGPSAKGLPIAVDPKAVRQVLQAPLGRNTVFTLDIEGQKQLAMVKSFDVHPVARELEHADFYTVDAKRPVRVEVPFHTTGKAKGTTQGGILRQVFRKLLVQCLPDKIPAKIEIDVSNLDLGGTYAAKDLPLPAGVSVMLEASQTVVSVVAPEKEKEAAAVPGAPAAAAAAPAAGAKAAAPAAGAKAAVPAAGAKDAKAAAPAAKKK